MEKQNITRKSSGHSNKSRALMMKHYAENGKAAVHHVSIYNTALFTKLKTNSFM